MVILDTCALIELCKNKITLSKKSLRLIEKGAYVLSISFAEIACKVKLGKLEMNITPRKLYQEFKSIKNITIIDVSVDEWLDSIELEWPTNKDPADRLITAFAIKKNLPVITNDRGIKQFYKTVHW